MRRWRSPSVAFLAWLLVLAAGAPWFARHDPTEMSKGAPLAGPSWTNWLGTDHLGRDIWSRLVWGSRVALAIGVGATAAAALAGVPLGLWAGFAGGRTDGVLMRGVDTLLAIPPVVLALALVAMTGPGSLNAGVAVAVVGLPQFARLARAGALSQRHMEYTEAAVAAGAGAARIVFRTILPNTISPLIVQLPIAIARAVLLEASLSFLGLGTQPPAPSWGLMVNESRNYMYSAPWYGVMPGGAIALTVLALNGASDLARRGGRS
ncbi:MAG TPA: ABC transporter permease [Methylomirabilota bacterium]|nr:ABC transporter permease [Methylomirabilota bacterium]